MNLSPEFVLESSPLASAIKAPATFPNLDELGEIAHAQPTHVWIEPTNRCNTRCTHCGHFYSKFGQDMDEALYRKIASAVLDGLERIELIGYGEPFMAKHFDMIFDECADRGITIYTTSNGILLRDDARVAKIVRHNVHLCLSIDGARKETLEFVRPYIKWEKMLETLECVRRNAIAAGDERKFHWRFNFVAMKQNIADLPDLVQLAHEYGVHEVFVLPLGGEEVFEKMAGQSLHASPELVSEPYLKALALAARYNIHLTVPLVFRELILRGIENNQGIGGKLKRIYRMGLVGGIHAKQRGISKTVAQLTRRKKEPRGKAGVTYCVMPWKDAYFASDGTVFPCCIMGEKLGDMKEQEWPEIWNGQKYRNLRRTIHSWNPTQVCRNCALPTGVNGGDERHYAKLFSGYRREAVALDDPRVKLQGGFYEIERCADGSVSHVWMAKDATAILPRVPGAKFLRVKIVSRAPVQDLNPALCRIDDAEAHPFDNSCEEAHFPIPNSASETLTVRFSMENSHRVGEDTRELALAIRGFEYLL